jgi:murein L,D-transpeptidase YafK
LEPEDEAAKIATAALKESPPRRSRPVSLRAQEKEVSASRPAGSPADLKIRPSVEEFIGNWRKAWESKALDTYMSFYSQRFHSGKRDWNAWRDYKASLNRRYNSIKVEMENVKISQDTEGVKVSFIQKYRSDRYQDLGKKTLKLVKEDGKWKILKEDWRAL